MHSVYINDPIVIGKNCSPNSSNTLTLETRLNVICKPDKRQNKLGRIRQNNLFDVPHAPFYVFVSFEFIHKTRNKRKPFASVAVGLHFVSQSAVSLAIVGVFKSTSAD